MQLVLTGGSSDARQTEPGSGHAVPWQCVSRKTEAPPLNGSDLGDLRERRGQPLCLRRQLSLPNIFLKRARHPGPRLAQGLPVRLPSNCSAPSGHHTSQGSQMLGPLNGPTLAEPAMVLQVDTAAVSSSVPYSCHGTAREPVEKVEIWVQMQVSASFFINSKANRQKQNNNQKRDTPDGNVVLVSRAHKPNVIGNRKTQWTYIDTQISVGNLARQRDGSEVSK